EAVDEPDAELLEVLEERHPIGVRPRHRPGDLPTSARWARGPAPPGLRPGRPAPRPRRAGPPRPGVMSPEPRPAPPPAPPPAGAARDASSSRRRSASTSSSMVRLKSLEALRNSASILPTLLPISGSRRGPNTMRATTRMRNISGPPSVPNIRNRCYHAASGVLHSAVSTRVRGGALAAAVLAGGAAAAEVPVVELEGAIHPVSAGYVVSALDRAESAGAPLVVIRIDTPGGLDASMRQIVDRMLRSRPPVVGWVGPSGARAASAGFVITLAADL